VSGPSNRAGAPNYLLGDVTDGITEGQGDNAVGTADISLLGGHYGLTGADVTPFDYLDVGPTSDRTGSGLPLTDNAIDFEDLVIFALNYGAATAPALAASVHRTDAVAMAADRLVISAPDQVSAGQEFAVTLRLEGTGRVQALSTALDWKRGLVEPVGVDAGEWTGQLGGVVMSPRPGAADVALLGARTDGFAGQGVVAVIRFRALAAGDPQVRLATVTARDQANRDVTLSSERAEVGGLPSVTMLSAAYPNPFGAATTFALSLAQAGPVSVTIFSVDGRRVRTLATGPWQPGQYRLTWDGRDENGGGVAAGVYFVQLAAPNVRSTRRIVYLR
jgi:hypothetical protein